MSQIQDGHLIEGVLTLLDTDPIINPIFNCPAIEIDHLAHALQVHPDNINADQVCKAIGPLAETLFPTPRIPIPTSQKGTKWLVFEETSQAVEMKSKRVTEQKRVNRRTTMSSYGNIGKSTRLDVQVDIPQLPPTPSGISGEKGDGEGKRSFFKPLLLRKKKRNKVQDEPPITQMEMDHIGSEDDIPHISKYNPPDIQESPYEENDSIADYVQPTPLSPIKGDMETRHSPAEEVSRRRVELRIEANSVDGNIRHLTKTPDIPITPFSPFSPSQQSFSGPITPIIPDTPIPNASVTPITPSPISLSPYIPDSPIGDKSIIRSTQAGSITPPPSNTASSLEPTESGKAEDDHLREDGSHRQRHHQNERDQQRQRHRHRTSKESEHRSRNDQSYPSLNNERHGGMEKKRDREEESWLEITLKDLPFGPDRNMIRAIHSIQNDWKLFLAEIVCLVGLAYMLQRSGW